MELDTLKPSASLSQGAATCLQKWQPCRKFCLSFDISSSLSFFLRQRKHLSTSLSGLPLKISLIKIQQKSPLNLRSSGRAGAGARKPSAPQSTAAGLQSSVAPPVTCWAVGGSHSLGLGCRLLFLRPEDSAVCLQARGSRSSRTY